MTYSRTILNVFIKLSMLLALVSASVDVKAQVVSDADTFLNARPVIFRCNRTEILTGDSAWIADTLVSNLQDLGKYGIVIGRAAASPEGPYWNNQRLAKGRRDAAIKYLLSHGFDASQIKFEAVTEDYQLLLSMMQAEYDPDYIKVKTLVDMYPNDDAPIKRALKLVDGGKLWERLLRDYYPKLRAVRIVAIARAEAIRIKPTIDTTILPANRLMVTPQLPVLAYEKPADEERHPRREMFSIKSNLLLWPAYMPQYGWCPIPNGEVEFYPLHGNFTAGAMYDKPWWIHYGRHEFFELENITFYLRYYYRNGDILLRRPGHGAAYTGWYGALYGHWFRYQIGLSKNKGWVGEGGGPGLGFGYVLPISKDGHWRLDFGAQFGFFRTKYDPFVYGTPVERDESSNLYYYDFKYHPSLFERRQNHFNWFGPTRIGVSLSYDLIYRKGKDRGIRFRKWYKD